MYKKWSSFFSRIPKSDGCSFKGDKIYILCIILYTYTLYKVNLTYIKKLIKLGKPTHERVKLSASKVF